MRVTTGGFSFDIRVDAAGRLYVYERDGARFRHSMTYASMEDLLAAITAQIGEPAIVWQDWQPIR